MKAISSHFLCILFSTYTFAQDKVFAEKLNLFSTYGLEYEFQSYGDFSLSNSRVFEFYDFVDPNGLPFEIKQPNQMDPSLLNYFTNENSLLRAKKWELIASKDWDEVLHVLMEARGRFGSAHKIRAKKEKWTQPFKSRNPWFSQ